MRGGKIAHILNLDSRWRWALAAGGLCLWIGLLVPIAQDAVRVVSPVLMLWQKANSFLCRKMKPGRPVNGRFVS